MGLLRDGLEGFVKAGEVEEDLELEDLASIMETTLG